MKILGICLDRRLPQSTLLEVALNILNVSKPSGWTLQSSGEDFSQREITPTGSVSRTKLTNEQYHMDEWTSNGYVQNWCKTATIITAIIVFRRDKSKFNRIWVVSQFVDGFLRLKTSKTPSLKGPTSSCSSFFVFRVAPHFETHEIGKKNNVTSAHGLFLALRTWPWKLGSTAVVVGRQWPPAGAQKSTMMDSLVR